MTQDQFIQHEIAVWGYEYIHDLLDRGFTPVQVFNSKGAVKWTWILSVKSRVAMVSA